MAKLREIWFVLIINLFGYIIIMKANNVSTYVMVDAFLKTYRK